MCLEDQNHPDIETFLTFFTSHMPLYDENWSCHTGGTCSSENLDCSIL